MCTLIVLHRCIAGTPLAVGANRDEFFDRPAEGLALRRMDFGVILAPRDVRAGGTWLGLNRHGLFAAVTNRPTTDPDPQRRSRGLLVTDALRARSAVQAREKLEELEAGAYNPFNLLVADRESVFAVTYEREMRPVDLSPGAIVIGNADPKESPTPKLSGLIGQVQRVAAESPEGVLDQLAEICGSHEADSDPLRSACVHAGRYGTRSSTLIRLGDRLGDSEIRYTDKAPCVSRYDDYTPLLRELFEDCSSAAGEPIVRNPS